jgi:hypothetical protein
LGKRGIVTAATADLSFDCGHCGASHDGAELARGLRYAGVPVGEYLDTAGRGRHLVARLAVSVAIVRAMSETRPLRSTAAERRRIC